MPKKIYIIAGEASGDFLGSQLIKAIKEKEPETVVFGIGGDLMIAKGFTSLFPMEELSIMGIAEVAPKIPQMIKRINQTVSDIAAKKPDVLITIDAPDFSFRIQQKIKKHEHVNVKQVHYVAPTVWAWRAGRAKKIAKFLDAIICLFPFEPPYFEKVGLNAIAVGHPVMETDVMTAKPLGLNDSQKLGVFFGSRHGEIKRISPVIIESIERIIEHKPDLELIIPTLPRLKNTVKALLNDINIPYHIVTDKNQKWSAFKSCNAAIAVSGTIGLELSVADVPHLITYKANWLTYQLLKRIVKTKYAHLTNIILQREVVPEYIQSDSTAKNISNKAIELLENSSSRDTQLAGFDAMRKKIGQSQKPSCSAAEFILNL